MKYTQDRTQFRQLSQSLTHWLAIYLTVQQFTCFIAASQAA